jgi:Asp-tRNA(Asn)/Glu-tRNA(Gln) amidotransferase A subunit family amidase
LCLCGVVFASKFLYSTENIITSCCLDAFRNYSFPQQQYDGTTED